MKLIEIASPRGTYFGLKPTKETVAAMREFMGDHRIPNPLEDHKLHATVVYSRAFVGARPLGELDPTWKGKFTDYDIFQTSPKVEESTGESRRCLVMKFDCPEIHERHHYLRKHHGATHDFPNFDPHMTMSYDVGEFDHQNLPEYDGPHEFHEEYSEPLDLNWVK
jgi:hypothetical protein